MMIHPLKQLVEQCNIISIKPISDDDGNIVKIIVEYEPHEEKVMDNPFRWEDKSTNEKNY